MAGVGELKRIGEALARLGPRKLAALGLIGLFVFAVVGAGGYILSRPQFETLYAGLEKQDVARMGSALREAGVNFDVSSDGTALMVEYGNGPRARMLLAERGLPGASSNGYELFDKLGSLGLTSFMQEVTRVRALEGELARTIQGLQGVKAARVHLVMPEEGSFRKANQAASASVVVRTNTANETGVAQAIRHLVAAAVPGMTVDLVTVLDADGAVLASGADNETSAPARASALQRSISDALQDNIRRTLTPMVGMRNLNVSVAVNLNTDKKQINETIYNPESRVERSVRVVREKQSSQNENSQTAAGVERNNPANVQRQGDGKQASEENQKREELTNYEVSSKQISTVSGAYAIERLSVAVLVNRAGLVASLGDQGKNPEAVDKRLAEIGELATSAAGLSKERGDMIKVSAVNFANQGADLEPAAGPGVVEMLLRQSGAIAMGLALLAATAVLGLFVVRPVAQALIANAPAPAAPQAAMLAAPALDPAPEVYAETTHAPAALGHSPHDIGRRKIDALVAADEEQAAALLKTWIQAGVKA